jgi:Ca-activated chloride channel family protein
MFLRKFLLPATGLAILSLVIFYGCDKHLASSGFISSDLYYGDNHRNAVGNTTTITENPFIKTIDSATSTFSIDADGASYTTARRLLASNQFKEYKDALRTEELINYFTYNYDDPTGNTPIAVNGEVSGCPWNNEHKLIRIGIKGKSIQKAAYPIANFVLLIDVSGSMSSDDKLELLKSGFIDFVNQMRAQDRIAIVTYAGEESLALESTPGTQKDKIIEAIKKLGSGGSTNGAGGIKLAYNIAQKNFIQNGNNRVILGTDGDFNVGISSTDDLVKLIEEEREKGIFLTTLGVGLGNLNEGMMEKVANNGNGNYEYLDSKDELKKVFIDEYNKFVTVAKDVKVQVIFNKDIVEEYRLIGYENRVIKNSDFKNDAKDAGEIGAGQTITAIYEFKPKSNTGFKQSPTFTINFRYKNPAENTSNPVDLDIYDQGKSFESASENMRFAASLASLGMYLRGSEYKGNISIANIKEWANGARTFDPNGYRGKHMELLKKVK